MQAGQTIAGKYRLNRILGTGGMATVWSVTNVFTEREFAIKFMHPQVARTPEAARRFLIEAKVSARINHPNIIEVIDVGQTEDGGLFLVMELLTGQALEVAIRRQQPPMPLTDFLVMMHDVAEALAAAHRSGVIHRDLKPTNVFLHRDRDGRVVPKILDFGVSKIVVEDEPSSGLTMVGTVIGSPLYMSPEQANGVADIDGRTDVFAFGAILFEALTGRRPFEAPNLNALIVKIATQQPANIDDLAPTLPEALRSLVRECLVPERSRRLASFDDVADRIASLLPQLDSLDLRVSSPQRISPPSDPDATNALPLGRPASQRPPPPAAKPSLPPLPPTTEPPRLPPPRSFDAVLAAMHDLGTVVRRLPPRTLAMATAGSGVLALLVLVLGVVSIAHGCGSGDTAQVSASGPGSATAAATAVPPASSYIPSADEEVPVVSVDSLPSAGQRPAKSTTGRGAKRTTQP